MAKSDKSSDVAGQRSASGSGRKKNLGTRLRPLTKAQFSAVVKALDERITILRASLQEMVDEKVPEIEVDGMANLQARLKP